MKNICKYPEYSNVFENFTDVHKNKNIKNYTKNSTYGRPLNILKCADNRSVQNKIQNNLNFVLSLFGCVYRGHNW